MEKQNIKMQKGFSLIELMVAMFVFSLAGLITTGIFVASMKIEKKSFGVQNIQENVISVFDIMAKEIRVANIPGPDNNCTSNTLDLTVFNSQGNPVAVRYSLNGGLIWRRYGTVDFIISTGDVVFNSFAVCIQNSAVDNKATRVTLLASVSNSVGQVTTVNIQTTITSRDAALELQN